MTKVFHGLAIQKDIDVTDIPLFDAKQAIIDLCGTENSTLFKKIDFNKLKDNILQGINDGPNVKEVGRLFESTYKTLLKRMETC